MASASYGIMEVAYGEFVVSRRGNDSILTQKLSFPTVGTLVSYRGNSRFLPWELPFPAGKREVMYSNKQRRLRIGVGE